MKSYRRLHRDFYVTDEKEISSIQCKMSIMGPCPAYNISVRAAQKTQLFYCCVRYLATGLHATVKYTYNKNQRTNLLWLQTRIQYPQIARTHWSVKVSHFISSISRQLTNRIKQEKPSDLRNCQFSLQSSVWPERFTLFPIMCQSLHRHDYARSAKTFLKVCHIRYREELFKHRCVPSTAHRAVIICFCFRCTNLP